MTSSDDKMEKKTLNDDGISVNSQERLLLIIIVNIFKHKLISKVKGGLGIIVKHLHEGGGFRCSSALCLYR